MSTWARTWSPASDRTSASKRLDQTGEGAVHFGARDPLLQRPEPSQRGERVIPAGEGAHGRDGAVSAQRPMRLLPDELDHRVHGVAVPSEQGSHVTTVHPGQRQVMFDQILGISHRSALRASTGRSASITAGSSMVDGTGAGRPSAISRIVLRRILPDRVLGSAATVDLAQRDHRADLLPDQGDQFSLQLLRRRCRRPP